MSQLKFIFRADNTNVGDWWCPPFRYFPFKPSAIGDILNSEFEIKKTDTLIIGGGGIGSEFFEPHLKRIKSLNPKSTILWGAGVDSFSDKSKTLENSKHDLYGSYFDFIDEVGIRVFSLPQNYRYVPCASCMNNLFFKYREVKPSNTVGVYNHKRVTLMKSDNPNGFPVADNSGDNLEEKLKFLSSCEYIITNTYHGVYWGTLLQRKVICIPYKSGLFSFKYPPHYSFDGKFDESVFEKAKIYTGVLEESRKLNLDFYKYLTSKYDLV